MKGTVKATGLLTAVLLTAVCLAGCGSSDAGESSDTLTKSVGEEQGDQSESSNGEGDAQDESGSESEADVQVSENTGGKESSASGQETGDISGGSGAGKGDMADRTGAFELLSQMNVGWNLGNTLDAYGAGNSLSDETCWGNPRTTKEMIDAVALQGFNTIRIPVTWAEHMGTAPDYIIEETWMDRVEEVVQYCLDNDMYVILDIHHEPNYWLKPQPQDRDEVKAQLVAVWSQIAERFREYDNRLLFEGMNEPRVVGSANEWSGGTQEEREVVNELNAAFVDTVRAAGGSNADRCLILCTYGNAVVEAALKDLDIPEDDNIAVALHMYTPYVFTFEADQGNITTWDGSKKGDITGSLMLADKYLLQKGVPVIITEFGAMNKGNSGEILKWLADYMDAMNSYGIKCVWWDNGNYSSSGEKFAIFDRRKLDWYDKALADALIEYAEKIPE